MSEYIVMTDSSCDMPQEMLDRLEVTSVMLTVNLDGRDYINYADWREIEPHEFYNELRAGKPAKTSAANVDQFREAMIPALEAGKDILYIGFSSGLSGTYNAGRLAADELSEKYPERTIACVDSLCASLGQGMLVDIAAEKRREGMSLAENAAYCESVKLNMAHWFTVDDLFYLHRGGRVSKTTAIVGSALGIKPVMHVDNEGHLVKVEVARGRKGSIKKLIERMRDTYTSLDRVFIVHGDCPEEAEGLKNTLVSEFQLKNDVVVNYVGPVIGAHSGPGTLALFFVGKHR